MVKRTHYRITIDVTSKDGAKPDVRTIGGDVVFVALVEGQNASWVVKKILPRKRARKVT